MGIFVVIFATFLVIGQGASECLTSGGKVKGQPCVFPFTHKGIIYNACTWQLSYRTRGPWCSTKTDSQGNHIKGNWGLCSKTNCPVPPRDCGTPTLSANRDSSDNSTKEVDIQQVPWMASLGSFSGSNQKWNHYCGGSVITNTFILSAAHCFLGAIRPGTSKARLGVSNLAESSPNEIFREIAETFSHPKYSAGSSYFDVGLVKLRERIEFNDYIMPICLPFLPVDDEDDLAGDYVSFAGWGRDPFDDKVNGQLTLENLRVLSKSYCSKILEPRNLRKFAISRTVSSLVLPTGVRSEVACVGSPITLQGSCQGDSGSPVFRLVSETNRAPYYEQVFLVASGLSCLFEAQIYARVTNREILTWIQRESETENPILIVGGYTTDKAYTNGLLSDVELITSRKGSICSKRVAPIRFGGRAFRRPNGQIEYEASSLGLTGITAKNEVIVCGGKNLQGNQDSCFTHGYEKNTWNQDKSMIAKRFRAASVLDKSGNMLVMGGVSSNSILAESTEIYDYSTKRWRQAKPSPPYHRDSGITNHCLVRLNKTHLVLAGGYAQDYNFVSPSGDSLYVSGQVQDRVWLFDGYHWREMEPMSSRRDSPACSAITRRNGRLGVLVAGGCDRSFCDQSSFLSSAEILNLETGRWTRATDLPQALTNAKMEIFDGLPTIFGGINGTDVNGIMYQYDINVDKWQSHPTAALRVPRSSAAVFAVPFNMFNDC